MSTTDSLLLAACGDIMLYGRYEALAKAGRAAEVFHPFRQLTADTDLVVANLENALAAGGTPAADKLCLRGPPAYAPVLAQAGIGIVSLANNHCQDFGAEALAETRAHLASAQIGATGAGQNLDQALTPVILERNGLRLGFLAACDATTNPGPVATATSPGIAPLDEKLLLPAIDSLKDRVDHVILMLHWGVEYSAMPTPEQATFAHRAIEHGARVVLGHHPHCIQGIEHYRDGLIAYSLANLTDDNVDWQGPSRHYRAELTDTDRESFLLRLRLTRTAVELLDPLPLWLDDDGRPTLATGSRADKILDQLKQRTELLSSTSDLNQYWEQSVIDRRVTAPLSSWWNDGSLWDKVRRFRPGQIVSAWLLLTTYLRVKLSSSQSRWMLDNSRNDKRPMPAAREPRERP